MLSGRQSGVTLLELLITIVILAIIVSIGVPAYRDLVLNNRQTGAINELITALQLARSEAVKRNATAPAAVSICSSTDGSACDGLWSDGWIVFTDADGDGELEDGDEILRFAEGPDGLDISAPDLAAGLGYRRDGRVVAAADFVFCDDRGSSSSRVVQVGLSGRPAVAKTESDGATPTCE